MYSDSLKKMHENKIYFKRISTILLTLSDTCIFLLTSNKFVFMNFAHKFTFKVQKFNVYNITPKIQ